MMSHISKIQSQNIYKVGVEIKMKEKLNVGCGTTHVDRVSVEKVVLTAEDEPECQHVYVCELCHRKTQAKVL